MKLHQITPVFVDEIPQELDPGILYVCCRYRAVKHLCACGCGVAINIPLHPTGWTLTCDGVSVSLWPSIGNWSEKCQSHYWIHTSRIHWAPTWSRRQILKSRRVRDSELDRYYSGNTNPRVDHDVQERHRISLSVRRSFTRMLDWILRGRK